MPAVCKFFLKGYCRYGKNCRFLHPGENDYSNEEASATTNFSFKSALNNITQQNSIEDFGPSAKTTSSFSFTRALEATSPGFNTFSSIGSQSFGIPYVNEFENRAISFGGPSIFQQQHQPTVSPFGPQQTISNPSTNIFGTHYNSSHQVNNFSNSGSFISYQAPIVTQSNNNLLNPDDIDMSEGKEDISQVELKAYTSDRFEFRKIPIRPPPKALC